MENNRELLELKYFYITSIINDIYLYIICDKIFKNKYVEDIINDFTLDVKLPNYIMINNERSDLHKLIPKITNTIDINNYKNTKIEISKTFLLSDSDEEEYLNDIIPNINNIFKKYSKDYEYGKITDTNVKIEHLINKNYSIRFSFSFDYNYEFNLDNNSVIDILLEIGEKEKSIGFVSDLLYNFKDISEYIDENNLEKYLTKSNKLKFQKYKKSKEDIDRYEMEESHDMYVFLCKDDFKENKNGSFTKDIRIERMVKIDPYNLEDTKMVSMMKMRERMQGDVKLHAIWIDKDLYDFNKININDDEYKYLRKSIMNTMEKI